MGVNTHTHIHTHFIISSFHGVIMQSASERQTSAISLRLVDAFCDCEPVTVGIGIRSKVNEMCEWGRGAFQHKRGEVGEEADSRRPLGETGGRGRENGAESQ